MSSQYTNASDVKNYLDKKIQAQVSKEEMANFTFDVIKARDRENQDFLWIDLIDQGNFADNSFNNDLLQKIGYVIKQAIESNCSNLMQVVGADDSAGRQLLWLPKDTNCSTLHERFEDVDEVSISKKKPKIR
jgi:hypothetical protein